MKLLPINSSPVRWVVPSTHRALLEGFLLRVPLRCDALRIIWSGNGWQRIQLGGFESLSQDKVPPRLPARRDAAVPRALALGIPVLAESWNQTAGFRQVWSRIQQRLGEQVKPYLWPRKVYAVNGKLHVTQVYRRLVQAGLFRQYLIRYQDECGLFVLTPSQAPLLPAAVAQATRTAERFAATDGSALWRLKGSYDLLRARAQLHGRVVYVIEHEPPPAVRFCYEWLFNPRASRWVFSSERLQQQLEAA